MSYNFDWMQDKFLTLFYFDNCVPTEVNSLLTNDRERTFFFMFVLYSSKQSCRKNTKHFCVVYALCYFMYIAWRIFIANVKWQMTVFSTKVGIACHQWWVRAVIPTVDQFFSSRPNKLNGTGPVLFIRITVMCHWYYFYLIGHLSSLLCA